MSSRLRVVEHIEVFDMEGEMVASKKEDPFSYTHQKEYFYGKRKFWETNYNSNSKKIIIPKSNLEALIKRTDKLLKGAFSYVDDLNNVDVVIRGGSTINYSGNNPEVFMDKVLKIKRSV